MLAVTSLPGERLKGIRERMGLSMEELAEKSGLTAAEIAALEESGGEEMTARQMGVLGEVLDVPTVFWTTTDAHQYILIKSQDLPDSLLEKLEGLAERLPWAWAEQKRAWGDLFSISAISSRLQLTGVEDLTELLDDSQAWNKPLALIVLRDLGVAKLFVDGTLDMYRPAMNLAAARGISPQQVTQLIVQNLSSKPVSAKPIQ